MKRTCDVQQGLAAVTAKPGRAGLDLVAIGGADDHLHVLVQYPSTVSVAKLAHDLKGGSSYTWNRTLHSLSPLQWQPGYWAESVSPAVVNPLLRYIADQRR